MRAVRLAALVALVLCLSAALAPWAGPARAMPVDTSMEPEADAPLLSQSDRKIYARALRLARSGKFEEARALSRTARDPDLGKVVLWLDLSTPRKESGSFAVLATFLSRNPDWPGRAGLRQHAEMVMPADLPDTRVLSWFAEGAPLTAAGARRYAEALRRAGRTEAALEAVRAAWTGLRMTGAEETDFLARFGSDLRRADHRARLERLLWSRDFRAARRQARRLGPDQRALAEARYKLARDRPGVDAAIRRLPEALLNDPGFVFERARWRQRRGRYDDVVALLDPPAARTEVPARWWRLRKWTVRRALARGDVSVAYRIASGHGMESGAGFAEAEWLAGWLALRFLEEPGTAYRHFLRLHEGVSTPVSLGRGAFWAGEAARALGERRDDLAWSVRARQWYERALVHDTSYYGQLAGRRLGRPPVLDLTTKSTALALKSESLENNELFRIVLMLNEVGDVKLMERFLARLAFLAESGRDHARVAALAETVGRPDIAMRTARRARARGTILPRYLFPSMTLAPVPGLEPALLLALIRQESGFYPEAVSRAGARGLMQIMPATARQVARQIRVAYNGKKLLSDPGYNILLGRTYLSDLLEKYDGSYVLALAAYNAGPARADRWIKTYGDPRDPAVDVIDWIESIPIDETRNYVQRIVESLGAYRRQEGTAETEVPGLPSLQAFVIEVPEITKGHDSCCH